MCLNHWLLVPEDPFKLFPTLLGSRTDLESVPLQLSLGENLLSLVVDCFSYDLWVRNQVLY